MKKMIIGVALLSFLVNIFWTQDIHTEMSGGNFAITDDIFVTIQDGKLTGGDYTLYDSTADYDTDTITGGNAYLDGGLFTHDELILSLSTTSISLGTLATDAVAVAYVTSTITTDSISGYGLTVTEDGNLRSGANEINDVGDGTVTVGSEEYGLSTTGDDGQLSSDTAISGSVTAASNAGRGTSREVVLTFKVGIDGNTTPGAYSHTVTLSLTANP